jgi:hypothetical protein
MELNVTNMKTKIIRLCSGGSSTPTPPGSTIFHFVYGNVISSGLIGINGASVAEKNLINSQITQ